MLDHDEMGGAPRPNDTTPEQAVDAHESDKDKIAARLNRIDTGTMKAIDGFRRYLDSMSHLEAMEAFGFAVDTPEPPQTDSTQEYAQRLLIELHAQVLGSALDLAQIEDLKISDAQEVIRKVVAQLYDKLK